MMLENNTRHRRWVLASRPHGEPRAENFRLEEGDIPQPGDGELLLRTVYLSLDPYMMRLRMPNRWRLARR